MTLLQDVSSAKASTINRGNKKRVLFGGESACHGRPIKIPASVLNSAASFGSVGMDINIWFSIHPRIVTKNQECTLLNLNFFRKVNLHDLEHLSIYDIS